MEPKKKPAEINAGIIALIEEERRQDPRSFLRKTYDNIKHYLDVLSERFSPIN